MNNDTLYPQSEENQNEFKDTNITKTMVEIFNYLECVPSTMAMLYDTFDCSNELIKKAVQLLHRSGLIWVNDYIECTSSGFVAPYFTCRPESMKQVHEPTRNWMKFVQFKNGCVICIVTDPAEHEELAVFVESIEITQNVQKQMAIIANITRNHRK